MNYSSLLYFLAVIFVLSAAPVPEEPMLPLALALPLFGLLLLAVHRIAGRRFQAAFRHGGAAAYFAAENRLSLMVTTLFIGTVFALDINYHLKPLSFGGALPTLAQFGGLLLFFLFLLLIWRQAWPGYQRLFDSRRSAAGFVAESLRNSLPLVLPWLVLSLLADLLRLLPWPPMQELLASSWGELFFFLLAVILLTLFFPPIVSKLWGCTPLPSGPRRQAIEQFCHRQGCLAHLMSWPLLEGRALTAAVMGLAPRFRYVLLTPALLEAMDQEELESVLAHEIGHVKHRHILLYLLLLFGFSLLTQALAEPLLSLLLGSGSFWRLLVWSGLPAERLIEYLSGTMLLAFFLLYFRFLFGWFIRNFERQADLHAFRAQGSGWPLIRAFDKIILMAGIRREQKNWHHFGIGERINFLLRCDIQPHLAQQHDRKVRRALTAYFLFTGLAVWLLPPVDTDALNHRARLHHAAALVESRLRHEPNSSSLLHLRADLLLEQGEERKAQAAYEQALRTAPVQTETLNNLAWLLLTAKDTHLHNPARALKLAEAAADREETGYVLDTLAEAFWQNGRTEAAIQTALRAAAIDPANQAYYQRQAKKFAAQPLH